MPQTALWRIAKDSVDYGASDVTGGGAKKTGGRWNSKGQAVLYTSGTIALATLELLAHLGDSTAGRNFFLVRIDVPENVARAMEFVDIVNLKPTWLAEPPGAYSKLLGDQWLAGKTSALLGVPSVIVPEEFNVLINPNHPDSRKIAATVVRQYVYDPRL